MDLISGQKGMAHLAPELLEPICVALLNVLAPEVILLE
jgi:hypothetical protein